MVRMPRRRAPLPARCPGCQEALASLARHGAKRGACASKRAVHRGQEGFTSDRPRGAEAATASTTQEELLTQWVSGSVHDKDTNTRAAPLLEAPEGDGGGGGDARSHFLPH